MQGLNDAEASSDLPACWFRLTRLVPFNQILCIHSRETRWMSEMKSWMKLEKHQKYTHLLFCLST